MRAYFFIHKELIFFIKLCRKNKNIFINYIMQNINEKYYGKKILVINAKNITQVKYAYKINGKKFIYNAGISGIVLLILINFVLILNSLNWSNLWKK